MGLSFHDETSFVGTVGSLQFANPMQRTGNLDEPDDLDSVLQMVNISQERRDDIGRSDDIQIVDR